MVRLVMSQKFVVNGGNRLQGSIRPAGNKNAALPMIAATLLTDEPCVLKNVPRIEDVTYLLELVTDLGASYEWVTGDSLRIDAGNVSPKTLNRELCSRIRASILLAGPMLGRFREVRLPPPGGDVIGRRRVDTHFLAFQGLGAEVEVGADYSVKAKKLQGAEIFLDEPSVTGTENALMAAVLAEGVTTLRNAASEPHVQDLANGLASMGARIDGIGTNVMRIEGVEKLGGAEMVVGPDHIEVGSFIGLAAVTDSQITIEGVRGSDLHSILLNFEKLGIEPRLKGGSLIVEASQEKRIRSDIGGHIRKIEDGPWPAFPADLTSIAIVVATQCTGLLMIFEKMFESRLFFVDKLVGMGAQIVLCDPHRVIISGPSKLHGSTLESPDIRAGMAVLIAALAAEGRSEIHNIGQIDRGYEEIDTRLRQLGADIQRQ